MSLNSTWIVQAPKGDISAHKDLRFGRPLGSSCPVRSGGLPPGHAAGESWPLASLTLLWVGGWLWGQWCLSLRPCMAHVRPTFLLPTPHPGRTMPGLFTDPLRPLSSMDRPTLMMAPYSQQGVIQKPTSLSHKGKTYKGLHQTRITSWELKVMAGQPKLV